MRILCSDLEGVLVPEMWIHIAEETHIEGLKLTTRDISNYDELMRKRLDLLEEHRVTMDEILTIIEAMEPLPGAKAFLDYFRERIQVVILSDTFQEFAKPLMKKLGWPTIFCHHLEVNEQGMIERYIARQHEPKKNAIRAFKSLNLETAAVGDSYNDISMLKEADHGIFFNPPVTIKQAYPDIEVANDYEHLTSIIQNKLSIE